MGEEIDKYLGQEVFVAGIEDDFSEIGGSQELFLCKTLEGLHDHLNSLTPTMDSDVRVLHGVLTNGMVLPSSLRRRSAFFILPNIYAGDGLGSVMDADVSSINELADKITEMISEGVYHIYDPEDVFILYGYEIKVTLGIADDEVDDEAISAGEKILQEVNKISKEHGLGG